MLRRHPGLFSLALALFPLPRLAGAQVTTVDEGTFRLAVNGTEVGTETFRIRLSSGGAGAQVIADGQVHRNEPGGAVEIRPLLGAAGPTLTMTGYQVDVVGPGTTERITVSAEGDRLRATLLSSAGAREREYRAAAGTLVLDSGVIHQFYFVARRFPSGGGTVPVIVPRANRQVDMLVTEVGRETVEVGGTQVPARHLRVGSAADAYDVWVDAEARVLRVEHRATGLVAVRERAPGAGI